MSLERQPNRLTTNPAQFDSVAWMLIGCRRTQTGRLELRGGHLAFTDAEGELRFGTPLAEVEAVWSPWYYFGGGLKLKVRGETHRFTFVLPNDQPHPLGGWRRTYASALRRVRVTLLVKMFPEFVLGRMLTKRWLGLLNP